MTQALENLLHRLVEGPVDDALLDQTRAAVQACEQLPEDIRNDVLVDAESAGADASLLLSLLGVRQPADVDLAEALQPGPIDVVSGVMEAISALQVSPEVGGAVRDEAGHVRVEHAVLDGLELTGSVDVGEAVRGESGAVDLGRSILAELGLEGSVTVGEAVRVEAGTVDVAAAVMATLDLQAPLEVGEAVRDEAGAVDVTADVAQRLAPRSIVDLPVPMTDVPQIPPSANRTFTLRAVALAAAALMVVGGGAMWGELLLGNTGGDSAPGAPLALSPEVPELVFASASDVVVEDLSFGDGVQVFQTEGDDGALVLWIEEEVL